MNWYITVLKKYAVFEGRAKKKEYWMFVLFNIIFSVLAGLLDIALSTPGQNNGNDFNLVSSLYSLAILLPTLAVTVRRLHDVGKSGWWILIPLIPVIGSIWLFLLMLADSEPGGNQYGPNPDRDRKLIELGTY